MIYCTEVKSTKYSVKNDKSFRNILDTINRLNTSRGENRKNCTKTEPIESKAKSAFLDVATK